MNHSKLGMWLQPGGHIEPQETPDETARRETLEETGFTVAFHPSLVPADAPDASHNLPRPFSVNLHRIRDDHWHCSFLFLATIVDTGAASHADEHDGLKWFDPAELQSDEYEMPDNLRAVGVDAITTVSTDEH